MSSARSRGRRSATWTSCLAVGARLGMRHGSRLAVVYHLAQTNDSQLILARIELALIPDLPEMPSNEILSSSDIAVPLLFLVLGVTVRSALRHHCSGRPAKRPRGPSSSLSLARFASEGGVTQDACPSSGAIAARAARRFGRGLSRPRGTRRRSFRRAVRPAPSLARLMWRSPIRKEHRLDSG